MRERVHRVALALGVGVDRVRLRIRLLAQEPFDDVDGLPHAARDEVREQRDVVVGDVVVGDPAVPAVADVRLREEVVDQRVDLRPIRRDRGAVTPRLDQVEQQIGVDDVRAREVQLPGREVPGGGHAELVRGHATDMPRGLRRTEVRAVGERRQHVAQQRRRRASDQTRTRARTAATTQASTRSWRGSQAASAPASAPSAPPPAPARPSVGLARAMAFERRPPGLRVDHEIGVLRVLGVDGGGLIGEPGPELLGERSGGVGQAGLGAELVKQPFAVLTMGGAARPSSRTPATRGRRYPRSATRSRGR